MKYLKVVYDTRTGMATFFGPKVITQLSMTRFSALQVAFVFDAEFEVMSS